MTNAINKINGYTIADKQARELLNNLATVATTGKYTDLIDTPAEYVLPIASDTVLGGVKVGDGLEINQDGVLSSISSDKLVTTSATLTKDKNQLVTLNNNDAITLPTVDKYTEINMFTNIGATAPTVTFPADVRWQVKPELKPNTYYIYIFIYNETEWLGSYVRYISL